MLPNKVLVIEDDADTRANLCDILELDEHRVDTAGSVAAALDRTDWDEYSAIILDRLLPDGNAEELLPRLKELAPQAAILIVTGYSDLNGAIAALRQGAADYIVKPINAEALRASLARLAERQRLHQSLEHRVTELQTLLDVIPSGIAIAQDPACRHISVNPALARLLGLSAGANASTSAAPEERPSYKVFRNGRELPPDEQPMQMAAAKGVELRGVEVDIVHPDGEVVNLLVYAVPLLDERGRTRGAVGAFTDITERKRSQERALQTERLAALGQMVAGLAHESRNALQLIQASLEMLALEVEDRPEALELIASIQGAEDRLHRLFEDIRGYAAPINLERDVYNVAKVWRGAWQQLAGQWNGRKVELREDTDGLDLTCPVDLFSLERVFRNIFENALAACPDPVRIEVACADTKLGHRRALLVAVRDNGPGLTPEQRQRIFQPFYTTKRQGTGLGMAIARRIVEAHGGQITIGNGSQPGAEILVTLPREAE